MEVIIYTTSTCPYCTMAKNMLEENEISYKEIQIEFGSEELDDLIKKTHHKTVPQIFIDGKFIGGYDDLNKFLKL